MVLQRDPVLRNAIRKNELSGKIDIVGNLGWHRNSSNLTDTDVYLIHWYMERNYGLKNDRNINKAMNIVANENRYHPIRNCLEKLSWDGEPRIEKLLTKYLGAENNSYTKEIMRLLMLAAIHRVYEPGCKYEIMVCLVGGQGAGKRLYLYAMLITKFCQICPLSCLPCNSFILFFTDCLCKSHLLECFCQTVSCFQSCFISYENVVQIGKVTDTAVVDENGNLTEEAKAAIEVLEEYAQTCQERNPNLYLFNCVMHLDEATPHLHMDYIPVAHGRGEALLKAESDFNLWMDIYPESEPFSMNLQIQKSHDEFMDKIGLNPKNQK